MPGMESLDPGLIWVSMSVIFLAGLVHGTFGFGFPMVATPLIALFSDIFTAVLLTLLPTISVNLSVIGQAGLSHFKKLGKHLLVIPFALLGTLLGSMLLVWVDPQPFLLVLAAAILLYLYQDRLQKVDFGWVRQHTLLSYAIFGITGGLMAGTVNVMLPVLIILSMELRVAAASMIVLFNVNFLSGKVTQLVYFLFAGIPGIQDTIIAALWLVPAALLGLILGIQMRRLISSDRYLKVLRGVLWVITIVLIARFVYWLV